MRDPVKDFLDESIEINVIVEVKRTGSMGDEQVQTIALNGANELMMFVGKANPLTYDQDYAFCTYGKCDIVEIDAMMEFLQDEDPSSHQAILNAAVATADEEVLREALEDAGYAEFDVEILLCGLGLNAVDPETSGACICELKDTIGAYLEKPGYTLSVNFCEAYYEDLPYGPLSCDECPDSLRCEVSVNLLKPKEYGLAIRLGGEYDFTLMRDQAKLEYDIYSNYVYPILHKYGMWPCDADDGPIA